MLLHNFVFGEISAQEYGAYVLDASEDDWGRRDVDTESIRGRSGDLVIDNGRLENVTLIITVAFTKDAEAGLRRLNSALLASVGYQRLEHSFDQDVYRQARYAGGVSPKLTRTGDISTAQLKFDCMPQRFWKIGEESYAIDIGESASAKLYKSGLMGDIMSDAFKSNMGNLTPYEPITILNLGQHSGFDMYTIELYYPDDMMGKGYVWGYSDDDPTSASFSSGINSGAIVTGVMTIQADGYVWFTNPARWKVFDGGSVIDETYSAETVLENASPFPASPMIRIQPVLNTAFDNEAVLLVNDKDIRLNNYGLLYSADDVLYIDCETMNAYRPVGETMEPMNEYVILPNRSIVLRSGTNTIYTNSKIRSAEIIPRWWSR